MIKIISQNKIKQILKKIKDIALYKTKNNNYI